MYKIIFLITSVRNSLGEATQARIFAEQLPSDKYECWFAINEDYQSYINNFGFKVINYNDISNHKFDMVILSDYAPFLKRRGARGKVPEINTIIDAYVYLLSLNIPIGVMDVSRLYFNPSMQEEDDYSECIHDKLCFKFLQDQCTPCLPPDLFIINPCPPHDPDEETNTPAKQYFWRMYDVGLPKIAERRNKDNYKQKIIFMTQSYWQYSINKMDKIGFYSFILERLLIYYLNKMGFITKFSPVKLVMVTPFIFHYPVSINNIEFYPIYYSKSSILPNSTFENILSQADLILTDNVLQNTFHRALLNGILGINMKGVPKTIENRRSIIKPDFNFSAVTNEALNIMESTTPFSSTMLNVEEKDVRVTSENKHFIETFNSLSFLDEKNMVDTLYKSLFDNEYKNNMWLNIENYIKLIENLPTAEQIVEENMN